MRNYSFTGIMLGVLVVPSLLFGGIVRFDLSSALEAEVGGYDLVSTANEIAQGTPYILLGDHNILTSSSWEIHYSYI